MDNISLEEWVALSVPSHLEESFKRAASRARSKGSPTITIEHFLFALTDDVDSLAFLVEKNIDRNKLRQTLTKIIDDQCIDKHCEIEKPEGVTSRALRRCLAEAYFIAKQQKQNYLDGRLVIEGILKDSATPASQILQAHMSCATSDETILIQNGDRSDHPAKNKTSTTTRLLEGPDQCKKASHHQEVAENDILKLADELMDKLEQQLATNTDYRLLQALEAKIREAEGQSSIDQRIYQLRDLQKRSLSQNHLFASLEQTKILAKNLREPEETENSRAGEKSDFAHTLASASNMPEGKWGLDIGQKCDVQQQKDDQSLDYETITTPFPEQSDWPQTCQFGRTIENDHYPVPPAPKVSDTDQQKSEPQTGDEDLKQGSQSDRSAEPHQDDMPYIRHVSFEDDTQYEPPNPLVYVVVGTLIYIIGTVLMAS